MNFHFSASNHGSAIGLALKLLFAMMLVELTIMVGFRMSGLETGPIWLDLADACLLGLFASGLIYLWVVRPLSEAAKRNALFAAVAGNLKAGLIITDPHQEDNPIISVNNAFTRITGYAEADVIGRNPRFLKGKNSDVRVANRIADAVRQQLPVDAEQLNYRKDGSTFWNEINIAPVKNRHGEVVYFAGLGLDVTQRHQDEDERRKLAQAVGQADEAVCIFDTQGVIEFANAAFCHCVGVSDSGSLMGSTVWRFWEADKTLLEEIIQPQIATGQAWHGRNTRNRANGESYEALSSIAPCRDANGVITHYVALHRDISQMIELEQQLQQSQKMEAVGMLVSGIAHDFNNVLASMLGNLYLVRQEMKETASSKAEERLRNVENQGYYAAGMIRQLLTFSRKGKTQLQRFDLKSQVKEIVKFCRVSVPADIELITHICEEQMEIDGDPVQIQQMLMNLVTNARHAIEDGETKEGRIEISVQTLDTAEEGNPIASAWREQHERAPCGRYVHIRIKDNGHGMDEAVRAKVFEPFFTTKKEGRGTGLGLAMVAGAVDTHKGMIDVESALGQGCCFDLWLPLFSQSSEVEQTDAEYDLVQGSGQMILLADDDPEALRTLRELLIHAGYQVAVAHNGEEAVRRFIKMDHNIQLALLDIVMPKLNGIQAALTMRQTCPELPIALMTGYDQEISHDQAWSGQEPVILRKPWEIAKLNEVLRTLHTVH